LVFNETSLFRHSTVIAAKQSRGECVPWHAARRILRSRSCHSDRLAGRLAARSASLTLLVTGDRELSKIKIAFKPGLCKRNFQKAESFSNTDRLKQ
jgi:hypothetical protein